MLLDAVEEYVFKCGIKNIYLMTKGQEGFYLKNGYIICEPIQQLNGYPDFATDTYSMDENETKSRNRNTVSVGPPPPPMPSDLKKPSFHISFTISSRTFMRKKLES